jgi:hypothetical protein
VKKILLIILAVTLALSLSLTSVIFAAGGKKEVTLAQESGQAWLEGMVTLTGEPLEWLGAHLTTPQVCYGLDGRPSAYMFTMENNGEVVGYIVVGSSAYGYPMLEAADVPPPSIPSADEVKSTLKRDLAIDVASIGRPSRLLYLGFDNLFAVYQAGQQEVAVNLNFDFAIPASNLTAAMPSPEVYKARVEAAQQSKPDVLAGSTSTVQSDPCRNGVLTMSAWHRIGCDCGFNDKCWCGPSSGVSIGRYYEEEKGYSQLPGVCTDPDDTDCYYPMFCNLCDHMGVMGAPVYYYMYGPGFVAMTKDSYYHEFGYVPDFISEGDLDDYWDVADAIDSGWPSALMCSGQFSEEIYSDAPDEDFPPPGGHWVAIKGYVSPCGYWRIYAIVCTDSYSGANTLFLNWMNLGSGTLFRCTIKDTVIEDFEWGYKGKSLSYSGGSIGWTVTKGGSSVAVIDTDVQFTGTRSAKFYRDGTYDVTAYYSLVKPSYIGFFVRKQNAAYAYAYIGDGTHKLYTRINSAQKLQYYDTGWHNVCTLYQVASSGYLIEYKNINWSTARYDIYVDGDLKKSGASMQTTTADKDKMCFANLMGSGSFWIDDIFQS